MPTLLILLLLQIEIEQSNETNFINQLQILFALMYLTNVKNIIIFI